MDLHIIYNTIGSTNTTKTDPTPTLEKTGIETNSLIAVSVVVLALLLLLVAVVAVMAFFLQRRRSKRPVVNLASLRERLELSTSNPIYNTQ